MSGPSSGDASPCSGSSSEAASQLSLLGFGSPDESPSTSACMSISDGLESDKLPALDSAQEESLDAAAIEAEKRKLEARELDDALAFATEIVEREARAVALAAKRMSKQPQRDGFREAVRLILKATNGERGGKVVLTGVGKSGIIAKKISASLSSLGTPSVWLHPTEALHGDLGLLTPHRDVVLALSYSGSSPELLALVPHLKARACKIIALVGKQDSDLVRAADAWVDCGTGKDDVMEMDDDEEQVEGTQPCGRCQNRRQQTMEAPLGDEAWLEVRAPSSSTTVALAMGDALAFSVTRARGLGSSMFAFNHPGGKIGLDHLRQATSDNTSAVATPIAA
ncbi:SIS domain-containing protein [Testicularia cyperi]|uniref:SIS domain-containing protein n=1 Tax=Testicularia cyperi TaxID=1882483 RepID=A0A317XVF5_9BASI|nr:SIS domain-containing protein [Testicularia cyperi]